jgi:DHA1 family bicyclomycin/chloramphenicol resistance-like MFS transporter
MNSQPKPLPIVEFVVLLAIMVSIVAMATDIMLPALDEIGGDLGVSDVNDTQLIISTLFLGFAVGQVLAGPVSDSIGRKPVIYVGYLVFIAGCLLSIVATSFTIMLVGRVLQGLGAASPRIVTLALVRDGYEGRAMARIMSIVMAVFIIVPAIAPAIGQGVIAISGWRATFVLLLALAVVSFAWFAARQPETLPPAARRAFSLSNILTGLREACCIRAALGYTVAAGLIFGAFLGYLSSAQQIFQISFRTGQFFPLYFGVAALAIGTASVCNSQLVMRYGMRLLTRRALIGSTVMSLCFLAPVAIMGGVPPLWLFMVWLLANFFCVGIMFGNFNALAMEPLGHMAGLGAALVGSLSTFISLPLGWAVGNSFDGGVLPLVAGFAVLGCASLIVMAWAERVSPNP